MPSLRFENTINEIDTINRMDPHEEVGNGTRQPRELVYSQRMSRTLNEFSPEAPEVLHLAARGQHIKRWAIPRENYPMDRKGYLMWRTRLKQFHAELVGSIMEKQGYPEEDIKKVEDLINKKGLKTNKDAQTLEDVVCLVFLQYYFEDFISKHTVAKLTGIIRKTWGKMSEKGQEAARAIPHSEKAAEILKKALS